MGGSKKKAKLKSVLAKIFRIRNWKLLLIVLLLCFWAATLLRIDHIKMTELRAAVLAADEAEDDVAIASSLTELQRFTAKHIIFNVVEENGVDVGEMNKLLLQKVEELTLYVIDLQKQINELKSNR